MSPVTVSSFESRSFDKPDEVRTPPKTRVDILEIGGYTLGRFTFEPGWRWSDCIAPVAKTETCQLSHVGHVVSGRLTVRTTDGTTKTFGAGDSYAIPSGHDAWVDGSEPMVAVEVMSAAAFAKPG
jgi:quercetin dioxygenase-like cupin family protein